MTENQIKDCIKAVKKQLNNPLIEKESNSSIKEGYTMALEILQNYKKPWVYNDVKHLQTIQGRAIAILSIDFLHNECRQQNFCKIPIK